MNFRHLGVQSIRYTINVYIILPGVNYENFYIKINTFMHKFLHSLIMTKEFKHVHFITCVTITYVKANK